MPTENLQALPDGTTKMGYDPDRPDFDEQAEIVRQGFLARQWAVDEITKDKAKRLYKIKVSRGDKTYVLSVYIFTNFAWGNRPSRLFEKRIQLGVNYALHKADFELDNKGENRCLVVGAYENGGKVVLGAWNAANYRGHANPNSCYMHIDAVAAAMRNGFGQYRDEKGRIACCFQPDFIAFYTENITALHSQVFAGQTATLEPWLGIEGESVEPDSQAMPKPNPMPPTRPRNRILYGAPGTGKSHQLDEEVRSLFPDDLLRERVTFHPDFTYSQLVGSYRPVPVYRPTGDEFVGPDKLTDVGPFEPMIDYKFVPGPFLRMLVRALQNPDHNFVLVIEELNRANAPAVFGEVFQLLDRTANGTGQFTVTFPTEALQFLASQGINDPVRLPANFYLWATMNSADQGVLPLDAAFKRRWSFEYIPLDAGETVTAGWKINLKFLGGHISWNKFRHGVNDHLKATGVPEDRLLGPFFMREDELSQEEALVNKLLLYLRDDVVRHSPELLFQGESLTFGALVKDYRAGKRIFVDDVDFGPVA